MNTTGVTLMYTDRSTETLTAPSLYKIKSLNRYDLMQLLHYAVPRAAWIFEKAPESYVTARARNLRKMSLNQTMVKQEHLILAPVGLNHGEP